MTIPALHRAPSVQPEAFTSVPALFIRIQQLKEACWKAHIAKKQTEALRLSEQLRNAAMQLAEQLKG